MLLSTFMFIMDGIWAICNGCKAVVVVENNLFTNSLINATIQDDSKRERSDVVCALDQSTYTTIIN